MGLGAPHAYSVMDLRETEDKEGKRVRLMQLRNPWGEASPKTWQGPPPPPRGASGVWGSGVEEVLRSGS